MVQPAVQVGRAAGTVAVETLVDLQSMPTTPKPAANSLEFDV